MIALLTSPITWAIAGVSAYFGSQLDDRIDKVPMPAQDTSAQYVSLNRVIFYAIAGLAIAYGYKKVFK